MGCVRKSQVSHRDICRLGCTSRPRSTGGAGRASNCPTMPLQGRGQDRCDDHNRQGRQVSTTHVHRSQVEKERIPYELMFASSSALSIIIMTWEFALISSHLIPSHPILSHPILSHLISSHLISSHLIPSHLSFQGPFTPPVDPAGGQLTRDGVDVRVYRLIARSSARHLHHSNPLLPVRLSYLVGTFSAQYFRMR